MSDGPYKSLPMKQAWKDVSERAHRDAYNTEEREQSMCVAFHKDFEREVGNDFLTAIGSVLIDQQQGNLLASQPEFEIDAIKNSMGQSPLRDALIGHIQAALYQRFKGEAALVEAVNCTVQDHGNAHVRQIEEYYKRDATNYNERQKTESVRENLMNALASPRVRGFGDEIVDLIRGGAVATKLEKASGLDDGPVTG